MAHGKTLVLKKGSLCQDSACLSTWVPNKQTNKQTNIDIKISMVPNPKKYFWLSTSQFNVRFVTKQLKKLTKHPIDHRVFLTASIETKIFQNRFLKFMKKLFFHIEKRGAAVRRSPLRLGSGLAQIDKNIITALCPQEISAKEASSSLSLSLSAILICIRLYALKFTCIEQ
jgi:hypothetical protein